jgi:hypothetical protein
MVMGSVLTTQIFMFKKEARENKEAFNVNHYLKFGFNLLIGCKIHQTALSYSVSKGWQTLVG